MTWINNLKIAIIENDIQTASELIKLLPKFENLEEAKEAQSLIKTAIDMAKSEKQKTFKTMQQIKKTKEFLNY